MELLVVIAIIGILVAILLPAVQAAREAARRAQCQNNLKQIGLGMQSFHDVYGQFPPGSDRLDTQPGRRWGAGWTTLILPYMEQENLYQGFDMSSNASTTWFYQPSAIVNSLSNVIRLRDVVIKGHICPSSPLPKQIQPEDSTGVLLIQAGNYVGIMGASTNSLTPSDPSGGNRVCDCASTLATTHFNHGGYIASNGVIVPRMRVSTAEITDGTSNTIVVAEQSDWGSSPAGIVVPPGLEIPKLEIRASKRAGMWANCGIDAGVPLVSGCACGGLEGGVAVTVRHHFGTKRRSSHQDGIARYGFNTPIQSAHSGGAYTLRCDGSVHYVPYTIDRATLNWLCIRDDGQVVSQ